MTSIIQQKLELINDIKSAIDQTMAGKLLATHLTTHNQVLSVEWVDSQLTYLLSGIVIEPSELDDFDSLSMIIEEVTSFYPSDYLGNEIARVVFALWLQYKKLID